MKISDFIKQLHEVSDVSESYTRDASALLSNNHAEIDHVVVRSLIYTNHHKKVLLYIYSHPAVFYKLSIIVENMDWGTFFRNHKDTGVKQVKHNPEDLLNEIKVQVFL